jgi:outer membrane protein assembly factor BamB
MHKRLVIAVALAAEALTASVGAQEWTRFRGPNGGGLGQATNLPTRWSSRQITWQAPLPGVGHSSPVNWGGRLFVTAADRDTDRLSMVCLDAETGQARWQHAFPAPHHVLHRNNTFATSTSATDPQHVYVLRIEAGDMRLSALTHAGRSAWEYNAGRFVTEHGLGTSPIVYDGRVVFAKDHDQVGEIIALEADTGRLLWRTPRRPGRADYSVPCVFQPDRPDARLIFNSQEDGVCAVDPASGRIVWQSGTVLRMRSVSSSIVAEGLLFSSCGSGGGGNYAVALRPPERGGEGPEVAYEMRKSAPYVPTPLALGRLVFMWSDGGIVTCLRAATGEEVWQERVGGNYFSSPVAADGKVFNVSTAGELNVLEAGEQYHFLGRTPLGEPCHATPAIVRGRLYVRTLSRVFCLGPASGRD